MSIHREFRRLTERHSAHSEEAARLRRLLGEVAVTIDATGLELERIEPAWGSEAVLPAFRSAWIEERFPGEHASYAVLVRGMDAPEAREFMNRAMKHDSHWQDEREPPRAIGKVLFAHNNLIGTAALSAAGALRCLPIMKSKAGPLTQGYGVVVPYDAEGRLFFRGSQGEPGAGTLKILDLDFPPVPYPTNREAMDRLRAVSIMASHAATTVYSLLNCRNIALVDKGPGRPAMGREPENRRRRAGKTGLSWKVLMIRSAGARRSPAEPGDAGEPLTRAHLVRGHFKTFTAEKPLLGRAVGRFWWSPQVRGSAERGAVFKDYSVER